MTDHISALERLAKLKAQGALSEAEYEAQEPELVGGTPVGVAGLVVPYCWRLGLVVTLTVLVTAFPIALAVADALPLPGGAAKVQKGTKYHSVSIFYQADGEMLVDVASDQLFDTAQDCDRYTTAKLKTATGEADGKAVVLGDSVFSAGDASGYVWFACISINDLDTASYLKYTAMKMTPERAKQMKRFPEFGSTLDNASPGKGSGPSVK